MRRLQGEGEGKRGRGVYHGGGGGGSGGAAIGNEWLLRGWGATEGVDGRSKMVGAYDDVPAKSCGCELRPRIDDVYSTWGLPSHIKHNYGSHRCKALNDPERVRQYEVASTEYSTAASKASPAGECLYLASICRLANGNGLKAQRRVSHMVLCLLTLGLLDCRNFVSGRWDMRTGFAGETSMLVKPKCMRWSYILACAAIVYAEYMYCETLPNQHYCKLM